MPNMPHLFLALPMNNLSHQIESGMEGEQPETEQEELIDSGAVEGGGELFVPHH
mgnify:CR=1 FL=1